MKWKKCRNGTHAAELLDINRKPMICARISPFGSQGRWKLHIIYGGWWEINDILNNTYHDTLDQAKAAFENYAKRTLESMMKQLGRIRPCREASNEI